MKRMNIVVDGELLEQARRAMGEKSYSATIGKLLEQAVRRQNLDAAIREIRAGGDPFNKDYVAEMWPDLDQPEPRKRVSADERRAPRKKSAGRGTR